MFKSCRGHVEPPPPSSLYCVSPLVNEDEFAINGVPGDVLCGLDPDVCQAGLGDDVGVQAADGHQAAQVAALVVRLIVLIKAHLGGRPALQVACTVDGAEALTVCCRETRRGVRLPPTINPQPRLTISYHQG